MGQILHGSATTTEAVRRAMQNSQESLRKLAKRYGINPKTVEKWKKRASTVDWKTGPTTPTTNGKAERFVQTSLREWAYAKAYQTSQQRRAELPAFLFRYNWQRPHRSLNNKPPINRLGLPEATC
jgi:transposase InsO family protein